MSNRELAETSTIKWARRHTFEKGGREGLAGALDNQRKKLTRSRKAKREGLVGKMDHQRKTSACRRKGLERRPLANQPSKRTSSLVEKSGRVGLVGALNNQKEMSANGGKG